MDYGAEAIDRGLFPVAVAQGIICRNQDQRCRPHGAFLHSLIKLCGINRGLSLDRNSSGMAATTAT